MEDNDAIQLADRVINDLNQSTVQLRSSATSVSRTMTGIDNIVSDAPKLAILQAGLTKRNVDIAQLNALRTKIKAEVTHIHTNIKELTTY